MEIDNGYEFEGEEIPMFVVKVSHEAKLKELLRNITSVEIKLCSDASKEFIKLLKGNTGGELLHEYIQTSSNCTELLQAWKLRQGKPGFSYVLSLISAILSHPDGKYKAENTGGTAMSRALDKFARLILEEKLGDIYKELNSKDAKCQNAALFLLASIVRRGSGLASDVAKSFDFKLPVFPKLAEYKKRKIETKSRHSTRRSFIGFAMSFLEVGKPGLLRWVIQQKEMFSGVLRGLGGDDDEAICYVLSTLRERVLTPESLVPPGLRSVLFGSVTLEQLLSISGRENGGLAAEIAHKVLVMVCTDPSNGLMPDLKRQPNPLRGNTKRLLDLMKKLKATDIEYHRDLLLAIVNGRPSFGSAYLDEFPYNLDDHTSPTWSAAVSLVANLVSSVAAGVSFGFLDCQLQDQLSFNGSDVQSIIKCICPRPFTRLVINKGLLHSDSIVKHGTLRLVLVTLKLLDSFIHALSNGSHSSLKQDILNEVRVLLPDPQVLLSLLSSLNSRYKSPDSCLKRPADSEVVLENNTNANKKLKISSVNEETDILVAGISYSPDIDLPGDNEGALGTENADGLDDGDDHIAEIWGLRRCGNPHGALEDEETYFYSKLLDTLKIYHRTMPTVLEGSFDFFKVLPSNALALPTILQQSLLSLLIEHIGWSSTRKIPARTQPLMYRHLYAFINLLICSPIREIKDQAYVLTQAAMLSTGAFDNNQREISAWFLFLPGYNSDNVSIDMFQKFSSVVSFLCDAVSTIGNNLFKHWDLLKCHIYHLKGSKDVSPSFSPLVICVLEKCLRILNSESGILSLPEKSMISLYVSNTLSYLLQNQVEAGLLSSLVSLILSNRLEDQVSVVDVSDDFCEWRPLKNLLLFVKSTSDEKTCSISSHDREVESISNGSFGNSLDAVKKVVTSGFEDDGLAGITTAFSFSMLCTPPIEILRNFPSVISISHKLQGDPLPFLFSMFFLDRHLLIDVSKLWPDMFFTGLERALMIVDEKEMKEEAIGNVEIDSTESVSIAFCSFLKRAPFYVVFPAIVSTDSSYLLGCCKLQDFLLAKLSEGTPDDLISSLRLVLFWFHKTQLSYALKPLDALEQLSDMCFILLEKTLAKIFVEKIDCGCSQELAEIILGHPSVASSLKCPLSGSEKFTEVIFGESAENFIFVAKQGLHKIDNNVLNIVAATLDHIFAFSNSQRSVCEVDYPNKAFKSLVQKLFQILRDRLDSCLKTEKNLLPLIPTLVTLHNLINFLSPFDLLELVDWIFSRIDLDESTVLASSKKSALSVGLSIAGWAFDLLSAYLQQPYAKEKSFNTWEIEEKTFDVALFERIYSRLVEIVSSFELDVADLCLLKAINVSNLHKVVRKRCLQFCVLLSRLIATTPMKVVSLCIQRPSLTKAQLLFLLTEVSPQHLSLFGHFLSELMNKSLLPRGNTNISDDQFMILLPNALSYLNSTRIKYGKRFYYRHLTDISSFYSRILLSGFCNWKSYVSSDIFQEESAVVLPSSLDELIDFVNNSLLGKSVLMLRYYFASSGLPMKLKKRLKLFDCICPFSGPDDDLLDCEFSEIDAYSSNQCLNLITKAAAKIRVCRMLLFPNEEIKVDGDKKESSSEVGSNKESPAGIRFLNILVQTWHLIVKKFPSNSDGFSEGECTKYSLFRPFEVFILRSILDLTAEMRNCPLKTNSLPYIEQLVRSSLLHRFEDELTVRLLRSVLFTSEGKFSPNLVLQLLLAHSQFVPIIQSGRISSGSSQFGMIFRPMSSILRSLVLYSSNQNDPNKEKNLQLGVVKLLRVLFHFKAQQGGSDFEKDDMGINSRELLLLLLSSYGATLSEIDLEMYNLMHEIESNEKLESGKIAELDYLWGNAAINIRRERELEKDMDSEGVEERRSQFRENFPIDPRLCANTVLYFPYDRTINGGTSSSSKLDQSNAVHIPEAHSTTIQKRQIYDPVFILRLSIHSLSMGYIEPMEFASQGLLAIALVSISSPDYEIRKLAYEAIGRFKSALEKSQKRKDVMRLRLLLTYLQNGIEEPWQRIPSISSIFVAEASFLLLDPSHDHYLIISKMLVRTPRMNMKRIPLFHDFLWSSSVTFKTDRLWILRLLYAGLNLDDDAHIYIKNSVLEILLSFYASPLSDNESKKLILQIVKKSVKLHKISRHLVEHCCLISWLSSIVSFFCGSQHHDQRSFSLTQLAVALEVVNEVISSRHTIEWLQKYALEQLTELSSQLCKLLTGDIIKLTEDVHLVTTILRIVTSTLKISQKRKVYQPHFTLSVEGLFQIFEVVDACSVGGHSPCAELGLKAVLMSTPPASILCMNPEKLHKFVTRAISIALRSKSTTQENQSGELYHHFAMSSEDEQSEDSLISKLLRWLTASVILGRKSNYLESNSHHERNSAQTLQSLLENTEKRSRKNQGGVISSEEILSAAIFYLQQLHGMNSRVLPSSVSAICLLLSTDPSLSESDSLHSDWSALPESLLCRIRSPAEANPSWRWSYYQPWKDLSFESTDGEKMDEIHACQTLLLILANLLYKKKQLSLHSQLLSPQDLENSGVLQWERNYLETE
ncbi:hypothetical protein LguiB_018554 [Lonicera macranthoides]